MKTENIETPQGVAKVPVSIDKLTKAKAAKNIIKKYEKLRGKIC